MAISATTLTTTVSESITLNGQTFGNTITKTHSSIKDVMVRTVPVTAGTDLHVLYQSEPTNPEGGQSFRSDDIKYVRITNTSTTAADTLNLVIMNEQEQEVLHLLNPGCSLILNQHGLSLKLDASSAADFTGDLTNQFNDNEHDIIKVSAQANNQTIDVEVFVAAT